MTGTHFFYPESLSNHPTWKTMNVGVVLNKNTLWLEHISERYPERVGEEHAVANSRLGTLSLYFFTVVYLYNLLQAVVFVSYTCTNALWVARTVYEL